MVLKLKKGDPMAAATARVTADFLLAADSGLLRSMRPASRWPAADPGRGRNTNAHGWLPASRAADTGSPMSRLTDSETGAEVVGRIPRKQAAGSTPSGRVVHDGGNWPSRRFPPESGTTT